MTPLTFFSLFLLLWPLDFFSLFFFLTLSKACIIQKNTQQENKKKKREERRMDLNQSERDHLVDGCSFIFFFFKYLKKKKKKRYVRDFGCVGFESLSEILKKPKSFVWKPRKMESLIETLFILSLSFFFLYLLGERKKY